MAGSLAWQDQTVAEPRLGDFLLGQGATGMNDHLAKFFAADDLGREVGDANVLVLADFRPGRDLLELTYRPRFHAETGQEIAPVLTITRQGNACAIVLDGIAVALVQNVADLQPGQVILLADHAASSLI